MRDINVNERRPDMNTNWGGYSMLKTAPYLITLAILALVTSSCAVAPGMRATVTAFSDLAPDHQHWPTTIIVPWRKELQDSLEFKAYASVLQRRLIEEGFKAYVPWSPPETPPSTYLVAMFDYGIDDGKQAVSTYAIPQWGITGYSSSVTTGTMTALGNTAVYSGNTTYNPQHGITGYSRGIQSQTIYSRFVSLDLVEVTPSAKPKKVYEGRLRSAGWCGNLSAVMPVLLDAMFKNFPAGATNLELPWSGKC